MLSYYLEYRRNTENKNPNVAKIKSGKIILSSKCEACDSKNIKISQTTRH